MFSFFSKKKFRITWQEIPTLGERIKDIYQHLTETFVLGFIGSIKTYGNFSELENYKIETIHDVPELTHIMYGFQLCSTIDFFKEHLKDESGKLVELIEGYMTTGTTTSQKKDINWHTKFKKMNSTKSRINYLSSEIKNEFKLSIITQDFRLDNAINKIIGSMYHQVMMELSVLFGDKKLADKYMYKAAKGDL
jgi:hypothetical protein